MAYADYTFYTASYLGDAIAQANFARLALRASSVIDQVTYDRAAGIVTAGTDTTTINKIKMATCAVAETVQRLEASGGAVTSERIGSHSVSYAAAKSERAQIVEAAKPYLWNTGLMYQGFAEGEYSED